MYFHVINFADFCDCNLEILWSLCCVTKGKKNVENKNNILRNQVILPPHNKPEASNKI